MVGQQRLAVGIDFGGSGVKAAVVDVEGGVFVSERVRVPTPTPSVPAAVVDTMTRLVRRVERQVGATGLPVGVGIPGVVIDGVVKTAANIDAGWVDFPAETQLGRLLKRPVAALNDADGAGIAEMRFGAGHDEPGTVIVLTLGTGVGSAIFIDGHLFPNTELGHMEIRGRDAERRSASAARIKRGLSWKAWAADLDEHLQHMEKLFSPRLFILGGGVSKNADRFIPRLTVRANVVPAVLRNDAGIIGAAVVAYEKAQLAARTAAAAQKAEAATLRAAERRASRGSGRVPGGGRRAAGGSGAADPAPAEAAAPEGEEDPASAG